MIVSINYQHLFDFNREWNFPLISDSGARSHADYRQKGMLSAIGIAYAVRVSTNFSLGLTFNIWDDGLTRNRWEQHTFQESTGNDNGQAFMEESHYIDRYSLRGYNANLGFLWHINDRLTIGGVLKTPFKADVEHEYGIEASIRYPESPDAYSETSYSVAEEADLEMPISYGIGFAYRFSDMLTVSLDVYRTEWDNFVFTDSKGNSSSLITAGPADEVEPTHQVRMGAEYLFISPKYRIPIRAGLFYDPAPAQVYPDDFLGITIGAGIGMGPFVFDMACQYRFGEDAGTSVLKNWGFSQDVEEVMVYSSVIVRF